MMVVNKVDMMARKGPTETVTFEEMLEESKGRRHEDSWGKNILDRGKGNAKALRQEHAPCVGATARKSV